MTPFARIRLAACILGGVLAVQAGLLAHLTMGPPNVYQPLKKPFSSLPNQFAVQRVDKPSLLWSYETSADQAKIPPELPFKPIDLSYRILRCDDLRLGARCYVVHTENGEDRKHHPEICIRDVLKVPEVENARAIVLLDGDKNRPVHRYAFQQGVGPITAVYYWYYTFTPVEQPNQTWLQSHYANFSRMPPSATVEVTISANPEQWPDVEKFLITPLDQVLRSECLPATVRQGCDRLPIGLETKK